MADNRWIRVSDQDRENAVELLIEAYAVGRLSREELDERAIAAYSATTWGELRDLTADLPHAATRTARPSAGVASRRATENPARSARPDEMDLCGHVRGLSGRDNSSSCPVGDHSPHAHRGAAGGSDRHQLAQYLR